MRRCGREGTGKGNDNEVGKVTPFDQNLTSKASIRMVTSDDYDDDDGMMG